MREGNGAVSIESRALENYPYSFFTRYGEKLGTNPEELLGAAHAACFTMSFVRLLGMANFVPERVDSKSDVVIEKDGDGFSITSVYLAVTAKIPGIDQDTFQSIAAKAKVGCPVSKLIKVEIDFEATLSPYQVKFTISCVAAGFELMSETHPQYSQRAISCRS